ncbi:MAG: D-cysteine desulfhydrase family protein [Candidatus Delongbacteria bacterium]|nr:D-cysteine desulfhydrase family protein [Candidatus Delongbacteria bacterium]
MDNFLDRRHPIALLPTPIERMSNLSREYGVSLYIKRDDMTGMELGGNKIRKLEYTLYQAETEGVNALMTCGGIQSNHARAVAVAARKQGYTPYLLLRGTPPEKGLDGNLLLNTMLDAQIRWITPDQYRTDRNPIMQTWAQELESIGQKVMIIPEGASDSTGYLGYANAGQEIRQQAGEMGIDFDAIICAVGSGGTFGGLMLAQKLFGLKAQIMGVNVCDDAPYFRQRISRVLDECIQRYQLNFRIPQEELMIIDGFVGPGYAVSTRDERDLMRHVARQEGIYLDPVYTGKAFWAMDHLIRTGRIAAGSTVLFIHTGGLFGLFPQGDEFIEP